MNEGHTDVATLVLPQMNLDAIFAELDEERNNILHYAAWLGQVDVVLKILPWFVQKQCVHRHNGLGESPLFVAIWNTSSMIQAKDNQIIIARVILESMGKSNPLTAFEAQVVIDYALCYGLDHEALLHFLHVADRWGSSRKNFLLAVQEQNEAKALHILQIIETNCPDAIFVPACFVSSLEAAVLGKLDVVVESLLQLAKKQNKLERLIGKGGPELLNTLSRAMQLGHSSIAKLIAQHMTSQAIVADLETSRTLLHQAAEIGSADIEWLLPHFLKTQRVATKDRTSKTALFLAVEAKHQECAIFILDAMEGHLEDIVTKSCDGSTVLHHAVKHRWLSFIEMALPFFSAHDLSAKDRHDKTALYYALMDGFVPLSKMIMKRMNSSDLVDNGYEEMIHRFCDQNSAKKMLAKFFPTKDSPAVFYVHRMSIQSQRVQFHHDFFRQLYEDQNISLLEAPKLSRFQSRMQSRQLQIRTLLRYTYNVTIKHLDLYFAMENRDSQKAFEIVLSMSQNELIANLRMGDGGTFLQPAAQLGNVDIIKHLLSHFPADRLMVKNKKGRTALQLAVDGRQMHAALEIIQDLDRRATFHHYSFILTEVDRETKRSIVHSAAIFGWGSFINNVLALVQDSEVHNICAPDQDGKTALYHSLENSHQGAALAILARMTEDDICQVLPDGNTYLHLAAQYIQTVQVVDIIFKAFRKHKFDVNLHNSHGRSALDLAREVNNAEVVNYLAKRVDNCSICQEGDEKDRDWIFTRCNHYYHRTCVNQWFARGHETCPLCRMVILEDSDVLVKFIKRGDIKNVKKRLGCPDRDILLGAMDDQGFNALYYAVKSGDEAIGLAVMEKMRPANTVVVYRANGSTILHWAAKYATTNVVGEIIAHFLLHRSARVLMGRPDKHGKNALSYAAAGKNYHGFALIRFCLSPTTYDWSFITSAQGEMHSVDTDQNRSELGRWFLRISEEIKSGPISGRISGYEFLCKRDFFVEPMIWQNSCNGDVALSPQQNELLRAVERNDEESACAILHEMITIKIFRRDTIVPDFDVKTRRTILHFAALSGFDQFLIKILPYFAEKMRISTKDTYGKTALRYALENKHEKSALAIIDMLWKTSPHDRFEQMPDGCTYLDLATQHNCPRVVDKLKELGSRRQRILHKPAYRDQFIIFGNGGVFMHTLSPQQASILWVLQDRDEENVSAILQKMSMTRIRLAVSSHANQNSKCCHL